MARSARWSAVSWHTAGGLGLNTPLPTLPTALLGWEKNLSNESKADVLAVMEANKWWNKNDNKRKIFSLHHSK